MAYQTAVPLSSRLGGIIFVAGIHLVVVFFLMRALNIDVHKLMGPINVDIVTESSQDEAPPPPPPNVDQPPPEFVPPPEVSIDFGSTSNSTSISSVTNTQSVAPSSIKGRPNPRPDYPEASIRLNEEGSVILILHVTAEGRVDDSKVEKSSGFPRLDAAAQQAALRYRFNPGKQGGQPAAMFHKIKITFRICEEKQIRCSN